MTTTFMSLTLNFYTQHTATHTTMHIINVRDSILTIAVCILQLLMRCLGARDTVLLKRNLRHGRHQNKRLYCWGCRLSSLGKCQQCNNFANQIFVFLFLVFMSLIQNLWNRHMCCFF